MWLKEIIKLLGGEILLGVLWLIKHLFRGLGLGGLYNDILIWLVKRTQLFDAKFYNDMNADVAEAGIPFLKHYVEYGDREGRQPLEIFEPNYYRSCVNRQTALVNALLHYAYVGRYLRKSPSPWFDVYYYLANNKDVARAGHEPLYHYLNWGGLEGRSPNSQFDGAYYLRDNPELIDAKLNPLLHYLRIGRRENVQTRPEQGGSDFVSEGSTIVDCEITSDMWQSVSLPHSGQAPKIDVIVPVYRDASLTLRCLYSVLINRGTVPFELIVINDASPEAELVCQLEELAKQGLFTLLHNENNLGFVATVNRGMELHPERDVVLVNSDAEVYNDWLDRLYDTAHLNQDAASITPLSNNATICSYPRFLHDNPYPLETDYASLDKLAASVNKGVTVDAPTGVGFCMYMRRAAINEIGLFDEETFGKGYGEENDWCLRAVKKGWRNLITADTFVRHFGSASFQGESGKRVADAMKVLAKIHPEYQKSVQQFIKNDPLSHARYQLDWARLKAKRCNENILLVNHNRGGGSERHVQEASQLFQQQGYGVYYLRPERGQPSHVRICHPDCRQLLNMPIFSMADTPTLATVLSELNIKSIHSHGLVDFTPEAPEHLLQLANHVGVSLHAVIHDYKVICPRINLIDRASKYCGEPDNLKCNMCLRWNGNDFHVRDIAVWRERHHRVLRSVKETRVPDQDVAQRLKRYYPDIKFTVVPHGDVDPEELNIKHPVLHRNEKLKIVVVGGIGKIKGFNVLLACAKNAIKRRLPLEFIVMGYSLDDNALEQLGVKVTGRYLDSEALETLQKLNSHVAWLPSTWPETYSYTLSVALKNDLPVFAFDFGAIATRLKGIGESSGLMPVYFINHPDQINTMFNEYRLSRIIPEEIREIS